MKKGEKRYFITRNRLDLKIIIAIIFLLAFGCIMVYSASSYDCMMKAKFHYDPGFLFKKQLKYAILSIGVMCAVSRFDYRHLRKIALAGPILSFFLLVALKTPLGIESNGATRWLGKQGSFSIQVIEPIKIMVIVFLAYMIAECYKVIQSWKIVMTLWGVVGFLAFLTLWLSSNLSSALILLLICFGMTFLFSPQNRLHIIVLLGVSGGAGGWLYWFSKHLPSVEEIAKRRYQIKRIAAFIDPVKYVSDAGYQVLNSLYAIGNGGFLGCGLGDGHMKYRIPEADNDMIFAVICEELGIAGCILLILLYGYLLYQMYCIINNCEDIFGKALVAGIMIHFASQVIMNIAVAANCMPNTGISLPLVSSGGTSILFLLLEVAIVLSVRRISVKKMYQKKRRRKILQKA